MSQISQFFSLWNFSLGQALKWNGKFSKSSQSRILFYGFAVENLLGLPIISLRSPELDLTCISKLFSLEILLKVKSLARALLAKAWLFLLPAFFLSSYDSNGVVNEEPNPVPRRSNGASLLPLEPPVARESFFSSESRELGMTLLCIFIIFY
jgi:hypothetical protein